jgi:hypothetical protein
LATVRRANAIFVVKDNTLAERGTHDELLAAGGLYSEIYKIQFRQKDPLAADTRKSQAAARMRSLTDPRARGRGGYSFFSASMRCITVLV